MSEKREWSSEARHPKSIVSHKIKLTLLIAGIGSLLTILGGLAGVKPLFLLGIVVVAASPYISLILTLRLVEKKQET